MKIYLAGPITGLNFDGATSWRDHVTEQLHPYGIECLSPLRSKVYLSEEENIGDSYEHIPLSSQKGITTRDRWDVERCDIMLANLAGAHDRVSIGTMIEFGWADAYRKPVIFVLDQMGQGVNPHDHSMAREIAGFIVPTMEKGVELCKAMLLPYNSRKESDDLIYRTTIRHEWFGTMTLTSPDNDSQR